MARTIYRNKQELSRIRSSLFRRWSNQRHNKTVHHLGCLVNGSLSSGKCGRVDSTTPKCLGRQLRSFCGRSRSGRRSGRR